jgi:transcriptional regulator with XRE-family HTH domain
MADERLTIRDWRLRRFLNQQELAAKVGVSNNTISNWEKGIKAPTLKHMRALAEALGIGPEQIILPPRGQERPAA